jgi:hypothetical protein
MSAIRLAGSVSSRGRCHHHARVVIAGLCVTVGAKTHRYGHREAGRRDARLLVIDPQRGGQGGQIDVVDGPTGGLGGDAHPFERHVESDHSAHRAASTQQR